MHKVVKNVLCAIKKFTKKISLKGGYISSSSDSTKRRHRTRTWKVAKTQTKNKKQKTKNKKQKTKNKKQKIKNKK